MAFHVACPVTCRRICFCSLGFQRKLQSEKAKSEFLEEIARVQEFVKDPLLIRVKEASTVQVSVPRVIAPPVVPAVAVVSGDGGEADELLSAQTKRAAMQRKAAAASMEAEDYARRFETGDLVGTVKEVVGEEQGQSNAKVMCRLCFSGENEGSERARKMLSCKSCNKKYHRSCVKSWAQHRDLFHWSSWTCPSCRVCEVCRRAGDPNKFMFCKRCDGAYHCYCQQPPHKNVSSGPYLCPKHTKCHSCNSTVPGNGLSVRWFLGYTCCDACGRLFVKGNYCPVCLKVYRDSESTPMVCCDVCQRWVHCNCDGISDEKYQQFQADGKLHYKCATCRGECHQVRDVEDAVRELWTRRDEADKDLIANFRAAAGLPTQEEIFSISPFSDDEENTPTTQKNEYGRSLKFSLKGLADNKSPKKKSSNKKFGKKKTNLINKTNLNEHSDAHSVGYSTGDNKDERENDFGSYAVAGNMNDGVCSINQAGVVKHKFVDDVTRGINVTRTSRSGGEEIGKNSGNAKTTKGPKLVIHLGGRNRGVINSPMSESSCQKEQDLMTRNVNEAVSQQRVNDRHTSRHITTYEHGDGEGYKKDNPNQVKPLKFKGNEGANTIKIKKPNPEILNTNVYVRNKVPPTNTTILLAKRNADKETATAATVSKPIKNNTDDEDNVVSKHPPKDPKPLLRLKFKNPYYENQMAWALPAGEEEKGVAKGQRSKRKRPNFNKEEGDDDGDGNDEVAQNDSPTVDGKMDANWILQKLGKEAVGKRVEVHQSSSNSWHKGTIKEVMEGTSIVSFDHDDGKAMNLDLGKQRIRFVSKKQKR